MWSPVSAVVTWDDIKTYFKGSAWKESNWMGDRFVGRTQNFSVEIEPGDVQFEYKIEAVDDPADSEEGVSSDPVSKIAKFLGRDLPGGEFFEQMASGPDPLARALRTAADGLLRGRPDRSRVRAALRRMAAAAGMADGLAALRIAVSRMAGKADDAFSELESKMESKGWRVERGETPAGAQQLTVDVSGIYEATISVDSIQYHYVFQLRDNPGLTKSGETDDPIREFRSYYRSEEVEEALDELEPAKAKTEPSPESLRETTPVQGEKESDVRERGTVPARKPA